MASVSCTLYRVSNAVAHRPHASASLSVRALGRRVVQQRRSHVARVPASETPAVASVLKSFTDTPLHPIASCEGKPPAEAGVYAVYDKDGALQYIGISRKVWAPQNRQSGLWK